MNKRYRFPTIIIIFLLVSSIVGGVFADSPDLKGKPLLLKVSSSLSESLTQMDQNLSEISRIFESGAINTSSIAHIFRPYRIENPGVVGVILLKGDEIITSLNSPYSDNSLNYTIMQDISVKKAIQYLKPQFSRVLDTPGEMRVVLMSRPAVVDGLIGVTTAVIDPESFSDALIHPVINGTGALCVVMQPDGTILYSSNPAELTKVPPENFLTEFPTFRDLNRAMINEKEGNQIYELWRADRDEPKAREAFWNTINIHGSDWRVMVAFPR